MIHLQTSTPDPKPYTINPKPREISYKQEAEAAKRFQKQFADKEWIKVLDPAHQRPDLVMYHSISQPGAKDRMNAQEPYVVVSSVISW